MESILRMEVAQLCQEVDDDVSSDGMIENAEEKALEEVIYAQQPEPLGISNRKIELPKPSIDEAIVLGHKVTKRGLEVDQEKVEVIKQLPPPTSVKAFQDLKERLIHAPIVVAPNWSKPFDPGKLRSR
ncbi:hypothetical protein V6N13_107066 [Hibiscus sabdariffa]